MYYTQASSISPPSLQAHQQGSYGFAPLLPFLEFELCVFLDVFKVPPSLNLMGVHLFLLVKLLLVFMVFINLISRSFLPLAVLYYAFL
jgi:hypothetical protein